MSITALSGPFVGFGITLTSTAGTGLGGANAENNPQRGPSLFDLGFGMSDPRQAYQYSPGGDVTADVMGFVGGFGVVDLAPTAANSSAFLISSNVTSTAFAATAFTLLSSQTGTTATTIIAPETGQATGTIICIGSTAVKLAFGSDGTINYWNPAATAGRCVSITTSSSGDRGGYTIAGRDIYGYKVTETLHSTDATRASTNSSGLIITSQKAYKYVSSIVGASTITSTGVGAGFTDRFGFPLYVAYAGAGNLTLAVSTGAASGDMMATVVPTSAAVTLGATATATSTTGDVRGVWASSVATGSSAHLQIVVRPTANNLNSVSASDVSPLFGVAQYSSV